MIIFPVAWVPLLLFLCRQANSPAKRSDHGSNGESKVQDGLAGPILDRLLKKENQKYDANQFHHGAFHFSKGGYLQSSRNFQITAKKYLVGPNGYYLHSGSNEEQVNDGEEPDSGSLETSGNHGPAQTASTITVKTDTVAIT